MITGALVGACLVSLLTFIQNFGVDNTRVKTRIISTFVFFPSLGALIGSFF